MKNYSKTYKICIPNTHFCPNSVFQKKKKKKKEENLVLLFNFGLPWWLRWSRICLECQRPRFDPWIRKIPWRTEWLPNPVFLPGKCHELRGLPGYSPWACKESDRTTTVPWWSSGFHFQWVLAVDLRNRADPWKCQRACSFDHSSL